MGNLYCWDSLEIMAPSRQHLLAVHKKMAILITHAEEHLDILGLTMAVLSTSVQISPTMARLEHFVGIVEWLLQWPQPSWQLFPHGSFSFIRIHFTCCCYKTLIDLL